MDYPPTQAWHRFMTQRLRNIFLLVLCVIRFVWRGKANRFKGESASPDPVTTNGVVDGLGSGLNILVIQMAKMGDMVCTTPVFRAIKQKYPNARVIVMGDRVNRDLLSDNPDVSEYIIYDKNNYWNFLSRIRNMHLDVGILTGPSPEFLAMLYLSGAPLIVAPYIEGGYCPHETRVYKILRYFVETRSHKMGNYAPREYLRLLEPMGIYTEETKKYLRYSDAANKKIIDYLRQNNFDSRNGHKIIGISPDTGHKIKLWPAERFAKLADAIYKKYKSKIVVVGSPVGKKEVEGMMSAIDKSTPLIKVDDFSVDELKALMSKLDLFISVDTGPIYVAESFDIPTVCIVGPMDEREQPPRGERNEIVVAHREKPELHIMNNAVFDYKEARRQVEDINVEMVMKAVDNLMENAKIKNQNDN